MREGVGPRRGRSLRPEALRWLLYLVEGFWKGRPYLWTGPTLELGFDVPGQRGFAVLMENYIVAQGVDVLRVNEKAVHVKETGSDVWETARSGLVWAYKNHLTIWRVAHYRSAHTCSFWLPLLDWLERWMIVDWSRGFEWVSRHTDDSIHLIHDSFDAPDRLRSYYNEQALRWLGGPTSNALHDANGK